MRKLILISFWFPINLSLLVFSFITLANYHPKNFQSVNFNKDIVFARDLVQISPTVSVNVANLTTSVDIRVTALQKFLSIIHSPLALEATNLVNIADRWGLDYALIPAISIQESQGCKIIPVDSYNCWGFGVYGATVTRFSSYEEAINAVAKTIKESYIKNGLVNSTLLENKWAPQSKGQWSYGVNYFIGKIRDLEKNIPAT